MKRILMSSLFVLCSRFMQGLMPKKEDQLKGVRLKMALWYLKSIKTFRLLFISLLGIGICLMFLASGLLLLPASLLIYAPWSVAMKMVVGLSFAFLYVAIASVIFAAVFTHDRWLKIFQADLILEHLNDKASADNENAPQQDHD